MDEDHYDFEMFVDSRAANPDPLGLWKSHLTEKNIEQLRSIEQRFALQLDKWVELEKERLVDLMENHISKEAKLEFLQNENSKAILEYERMYDIQEGYNRYYEKLLCPPWDQSKWAGEKYEGWINSKYFHEFAFAFKLVRPGSDWENDKCVSHASSYLETASTKILIQELIRLQHHEPKKIGHSIEPKKSRYPKVFPNYESEVFFFDVLEQDWMKIDRAWVSQLFRLLKARFGRSNQEISIHATEKVFRIFWNELGYDFHIKSYDKSVGLNSGNPNHFAYNQIKRYLTDYLKDGASI